MSSKECETQLNELLEVWDLDEATLNQTDIEAIKHLLLENQMQQDVIISYKTTNLDQAVDIQQLEQENQQLKEVIKEVRESIKDFQEYIDEAKKMYSDLDDNNIVKVSCMQILNNQMVRNYKLLQILDKVKENK